MDRAQEAKCEHCSLRRRAEERPKTLGPLLWRLHTKFCPEWKAYQRTLAEQVGK